VFFVDDDGDAAAVPDGDGVVFLGGREGGREEFERRGGCAQRKLGQAKRNVS